MAILLFHLFSLLKTLSFIKCENHNSFILFFKQYSLLVPSAVREFWFLQMLCISHLKKTTPRIPCYCFILEYGGRTAIANEAVIFLWKKMLCPGMRHDAITFWLLTLSLPLPFHMKWCCCFIRTSLKIVVKSITRWSIWQGPLATLKEEIVWSKFWQRLKRW